MQHASRFLRYAPLFFLGLWACLPAPKNDDGGAGGTPSATGGSSNGGTQAGGGSTSGGSSAGGASPNGGSAGTSSSGTGGTPAPACTPNTDNLVNANGWVCDASTPAAIQGAFYSYGDNSSCTIVPKVCSATGCCTSGTTVVDSTYAKWGCGIGMELNSSGGVAPVKSVYAGQASCFAITLTGSSGGNVVRIGFTQSAATGKMVSPFVEIPPFANGWSGNICFKDAECPIWALAPTANPPTCSKAVGTSGTPYDLQIQVSAGSTAATVGAFNVCATKITPVLPGSGTGGSGGGGTGSGSCSSSTGQGTITDRYGTAQVSCNGQGYIVQNNAWGSAAGQTITYGPGTKFKVTTQNGTGASGNPASYPSLFIGANTNRSTASSGMPKQVSALSTVPTSWTWASNGATGSYNATYDVWFSTQAAGDPSLDHPTGGFLMVWYYKPGTNQPIGSLVTTATIAGTNWSVWYGTNSSYNVPCVSYVAQSTVNSLSYDLNDFIKDAVQRKYVQNNWYLTNVYSGFEIWNGGVGLETKDFSVTVK